MGKRAQGRGISLCGGSTGEPGMGLVYWWLTCWRRLWRQAPLSIRAPMGIMGGGPFTGNSDNWRRALEMEHFSMGVLWGEPGGGDPLLETWRICREKLWRQTPLSIEAPLGNLEGGSCTRDFKRQMKDCSGNGASLSLWELCEGNTEGDSFNGDPEGYVEEGSGDRHLSL